MCACVHVCMCACVHVSRCVMHLFRFSCHLVSGVRVGVYVVWVDVEGDQAEGLERGREDWNNKSLVVGRVRGVWKKCGLWRECESSMDCGKRVEEVWRV